MQKITTGAIIFALIISLMAFSYTLTIKKETEELLNHYEKSLNDLNDKFETIQTIEQVAKNASDIRVIVDFINKSIVK